MESNEEKKENECYKAEIKPKKKKEGLLSVAQKCRCLVRDHGF